MTLGFILRCARERAGLTLVSASAALKINPSSLSNYENDEFVPNLVNAARMSELYNLPWDQMRDAALGKG